jgi:DNA-binding HxlR family transcriptional regulator
MASENDEMSELGVSVREVGVGAATSDELDSRVEMLVNEMIGRIADKWTLLVLDVLEEQGQIRFSRLAEKVTGISQKMLTKTVRQMERDGLLTRKVYPVVPPRVEYKLTELGLSLSAAFCGVWVWAARHYTQVEESRQKYDRSLAAEAELG